MAALPNSHQKPPLTVNNDIQNKVNRPRVLGLGITVTLFIAENFWGASILANLSLKWGYALFLLSNGIILGWWTWLLVRRLCRGKRYTKTIQSVAVLVIIFLFVFTSPYYKDFFIKPQGTIKIPPFTPDSTQVIVHYGNRDTGSSGFQNGDAITTVGELKQKPFVSLKINEQEIFTIHIDQREICIDTKLFTGIQSQSQHIFSRPIVITNNAPDYLPNGWKIHQNFTNFEIDNQYGIPVLLLEYKNPYTIIISGLFVTPMGICKVCNQSTVFTLGDTFEQLGTTYKVDVVTINTVLDLFKTEKTYDLAKWR